MNILIISREYAYIKLMQRTSIPLTITSPEEFPTLAEQVRANLEVMRWVSFYGTHTEKWVKGHTKQDYCLTLGNYGFSYLQLSGEYRILTYLVYPEYHNQGYGKQLLFSTLDWLSTNKKTGTLLTRTHNENIASLNLLKKANFLDQGTADNHTLHSYYVS